MDKEMEKHLQTEHETVKNCQNKVDDQELKFDEHKQVMQNIFLRKYGIVKNSYIEERISNYLKDKEYEYTQDQQFKQLKKSLETQLKEDYSRQIEDLEM